MPVGVKDAFCTADLPTTFGTAAAVPRRGRRDAVAVSRLKRAGAVVVGKTNCGELCMGDYVLAGAPVNPRAPGRSVSGSSGGCAAAVAAGLVPASICTDTGGSARIPAAFCGVVGVKLTTGAVPLDGAVALAPSLDAAGVIAQSVGVARKVAFALLGRTDYVGGRPRLAVVATESVGDQRIANALAVVAWHGAVEVARPDFGRWEELHRAVVGHESRAAHSALLDDRRLGSELRDFLARQPPRNQGNDVRTRLHAELELALDGVDVLVTPAVDGPPPASAPSRDSPAFWRQLEWLAPINHTGNPSLVLPVPGGGLPVGLQLIARAGSEGALFAAAAVVSAALAAA